MRIELKMLLVGASMALAACGGDSIECGAGTVEMDGMCVPTGSEIMCGTGTVLDMMSGNCVPEGGEVTTCGAGTTRDAMTGACEPDVECGTGTSPMGGECVPDGTVICADGTMFDTATGTCLPNDDLGTCADGTTLIDGECVPNDETLMGETFAAAEPDDPAFDGTPATFIPPGIDMEITAEGCITPADFDMDDVTDIDRDFFSFAVSGPGLFRINVDGLGGLAAGFLVSADDGPLVDQGWARFGLNYSGDTSERQVYLPRAGNYTIAIFDTRSFNAAEGAFTTPVGNEDTCYFMTVEALAIPTPTAIVDGMATGVLGDAQFYTFTATERGTQFIRLIESAPAAIAGLVTDASGEILTSASAPLGDEQEAIAYPSALNTGESILIVVEPVLVATMDPVPWRLEFEGVPELPNDGTLTFTNVPDADFAQLAFIEGTAGDIVHFRATSDDGDSLRIRIIEPGFGTLFTVCNPCTNTDEYFAVGVTGTHLVQFINVDGDEGADYDVTSLLSAQTPPALTADTAATITLADTRTFVRLDTSSIVWTRYDLTAFMGATFDNVDFGIHADEPGILGAAPDGQDALATSLSRIDGIEFGGPLLIEVAEPVAFDGDESVSLTFGSETFTDVTTDPTADYTETATAVSDTASAYYFVRGIAGGELTFEVTGLTGTDPTLSLLDGDALPAAGSPLNATGADGAETFTRVVPDSGFFAFEVSAVAAGTVDITISQLPPPYTQMAGSTGFASICPGSGGAGALVAITNGDSDDGSSDLITFTTFTGFEFFGAPVTTYQVSTNGFVSFQADPIDDTGTWFPDLGADDTQNALVSAYWYDLDPSQVCVLEEAGRVIFEWNGDVLSIFGGTLGTVETQAILTAATGTVELVYGPNHDQGANPDAPDPRFPAGTGLENQDASSTVRSTAEPAASTSVLYTPSM